MSWSRKTAIGLGVLVAACVAAVLLIPSTPAKSPVFLGYYRYQFKLTPETASAVQVTATFADESKKSEVVFVHPKSMPPDEVMKTPQSDYASKSVLRLEVSPNSMYPPAAQAKLVEAFEYAAKKTLDEKGETYQFAELEGAPLPGFAVEIKGAKPVTQVFMKGKLVHYLFTSAGDSAPLHEMLSSLIDSVELPKP